MKIKIDITNEEIEMIIQRLSFKPFIQLSGSAQMCPFDQFLFKIIQRARPEEYHLIRKTICSSLKSCRQYRRSSCPDDLKKCEDCTLEDIFVIDNEHYHPKILKKPKHCIMDENGNIIAKRPKRVTPPSPQPRRLL